MIDKSDVAPTQNWLRVAKEYKLHAKDWENCCTFTDEDALAQYMSETYGGEHFFSYARRNPDGKYNGFAVGKHWMDVMQAYYVQDILQGDFCKAEYAQVISTVNLAGKFDIAEIG